MVQPLKVMFPIIFNVVGRCSRHDENAAPGYTSLTAGNAYLEEGLRSQHSVRCGPQAAGMMSDLNFIVFAFCTFLKFLH